MKVFMSAKVQSLGIWGLRLAAAVGMCGMFVISLKDIAGPAPALTVAITVVCARSTAGESLLVSDEVIKGTWVTGIPITLVSMGLVHLIPARFHSLVAALHLIVVPLLTLWIASRNGLNPLSRKIALVSSLIILSAGFDIFEQLDTRSTTLQDYLYGLQIFLGLHMCCVFGILPQVVATKLAIDSLEVGLDQAVELQRELLDVYISVTRTNRRDLVELCKFLLRQLDDTLKPLEGLSKNAAWECKYTNLASYISNPSDPFTTLFRILLCLPCRSNTREQRLTRACKRLYILRDLMPWLNGMFVPVRVRAGEPVLPSQKRYAKFLYVPLVQLVTASHAVLVLFKAGNPSAASVDALQHARQIAQEQYAKARFHVLYANPSSDQLDARAAAQQRRRAAFCRNIFRYADAVLDACKPKEETDERVIEKPAAELSIMSAKVHKWYRPSLALPTIESLRSFDYTSFKQPIKLAISLTLVSMFRYVAVLQEAFPLAIWMTITVVFVMSPDLGSSLRTSLNRLLGSVLACVFAIFAITITENVYVMIVLSCIFIFGCTFYRGVPTTDYAVLVAQFTVPLLLVRDGTTEELVCGRVFMTAWGLILYLLVERLLWQVDPSVAVQDEVDALLALNTEAVQCAHELCETLQTTEKPINSNESDSDNGYIDSKGNGHVGSSGNDEAHVLRRAEGSYWQHSSAKGWVYEKQKIPEHRKNNNNEKDEKEAENYAIDVEGDVETANGGGTEWRRAGSHVAVKEKGRMQARRKRILVGLREKLDGIRLQAPLAALKPEVARRFPFPLRQYIRVADAAEALVLDHEQILLQFEDMHRHHERWQRNLEFGRVSFLIDGFSRALDKLQSATVFQLRHHGHTLLTSAASASQNASQQARDVATASPHMVAPAADVSRRSAPHELLRPVSKAPSKPTSPFHKPLRSEPTYQPSPYVIDIKNPNRIPSALEDWASPANAVAGLQEAIGIQENLVTESKVFYDDIVSSYSARLRVMLTDACVRRYDGNEGDVRNVPIGPNYQRPSSHAGNGVSAKGEIERAKLRKTSMRGRSNSWPPISPSSSDETDNKFEINLSSHDDEVAMPVVQFENTFDEAGNKEPVAKVSKEPATKEPVTIDPVTKEPIAQAGWAEHQKKSEGQTVQVKPEQLSPNSTSFVHGQHSPSIRYLTRTRSIPNIVDLCLNHDDVSDMWICDEKELRHAEGRRFELSTTLPLQTEDSMDMGTLSFYMQNYCSSLVVLAEALQAVLYEEHGHTLATERGW